MIIQRRLELIVRLRHGPTPTAHLDERKQPEQPLVVFILSCPTRWGGFRVPTPPPPPTEAVLTSVEDDEDKKVTPELPSAA